jgi:hypothetical protein
MSLSDLASIGSFVSGAAVLVSLIFLYFQLRQLGQQVRQAERNQQASIRHSRITRAVDIQLARADPGLTEAWRHGARGSIEVTQTEVDQFLTLCRAQFLHLEDGFHQHEEGLLNEDAFTTVLAGVRTLASIPGVRVAWERNRRNYGGRFVAFVDGVVASARLEPPNRTQSVDEWRAAIAAETVSAPH